MRSDRSMNAEESPLQVRAATQGDRDEIRALVRSERLNPTDLDWRRFVVAVEGTQIIGAVQLRAHADGSRELGSLVMRRQARGQGVAAAMIDALLPAERGRVLMMTNSRCAARYVRWNFRRIRPGAAPGSVRRDYRIGQAIAVFRSLLRGRRPLRLAILERTSGSPTVERTRGRFRHGGRTPRGGKRRGRHEADACPAQPRRERPARRRGATASPVRG
jgi:amino-acid N-acetyltransferase